MPLNKEAKPNENKPEILSNCSRVSTIVCLRHFDSNEALVEKAMCIVTERLLENLNWMNK